MADERIDLASDRATLILGGRPADTIRFAEVESVHVVEMAYGLVQGDEPFYAVVLSDRVWVIPDDVNGLDALMAAVVPVLLKQERVFRSITPKVPWSWRKGRFLRPFPIARLAHHPARTIPEWEIRPLDPSEAKRLLGATCMMQFCQVRSSVSTAGNPNSFAKC